MFHTGTDKIIAKSIYKNNSIEFRGYCLCNFYKKYRLQSVPDAARMSISLAWNIYFTTVGNMHEFAAGDFGMCDAVTENEGKRAARIGSACCAVF